ncbi:MAG: 2-oxoacid:acceptor oxidoreductase subunit alpha [Dissulfurispiraceae bacterium]|jgi:2-oxoglutarate ferredoxin oxidoreductase subunit alpha|nr:2-oxoacid:acceptor oxidoreductase subunit alpha [Dissulfurispiraceae bacterium]
MDYVIKIGGEAGQGIQTIGDTLAKVFARSGYHVFTDQDYESRVRGGHNFYRIRFSDKPVICVRESVDILVALDAESIKKYENMLSSAGIVIYDSTQIKEVFNSERFIDIPFIKLAQESGGSRIMANTVAIGAVHGMLKLDLDTASQIFRETFARKGDDVVKVNIDAAKAGFDFASSECKQCSFRISEKSEPLMLISTTEALAAGAMAAGCRFYAAYPMTPSTGIMNYLASKEASGSIMVEQAEDEIAAINMALGASYAGLRAMTGTSGGGFALMVEGISLAGMTETPVVVCLGQRPGPATGLPTRTEQADLLFSLFAGHGEFPRIIFAPRDPEQAFYLMNKAFDLAEKYQIPGIILFDQYLSDALWTYKGFDLSKIKFTDYRLRADELKTLNKYSRYSITETGVTPMAVPGASEHLVVVDSDEHSEEGHIIEDAETRIAMVNKRLHKKMPLIIEEISGPLVYGSKDPELVLTGWGSTYGPLKEAVDVLSKKMRVALVHFQEIYPLPSDEHSAYLDTIRSARISICVENNATSQFAFLLRAEKGMDFTHHINRFDGRPFILESILEEISALV